MDTASVVASIDMEIARLQQARAVLSGGAGTGVGNGRKTAMSTKPKKRRKFSAEARRRIGDAQRKRWAAARAKK
jgi:hypothetical protein